MIGYELIRSKRKTLTIYVKPDGRVEVRAPLKLSKEYIDDFVTKKADWINSTLLRFEKRRVEKKTIELTSKEVVLYKKKAAYYFEQRCIYFAQQMDACYGKIKVNQAKTRWGSCNARGDINFTYRLIFAPSDLIDYVIVHELAHLKEMNHSSSFWTVVEKTMPDYRERRKKLREFQRKIEWRIEYETK